MNKGNGAFFGLGWGIEGPFMYVDTNHTPTDTSDDIYHLVWNGTDYKLINQGSGIYKTNIETFLNIKHQTGSTNNATGDYWTVQKQEI